MSARPSVLVFGSVNVDLVMRVSTLPISGETVLTDDYQPLPGGKGANQALAARRAGADSVFVGAVGDDAHGILALALLEQDGVDLSYTVKSNRNTGCAVVMVDEVGCNLIGVASGANQDIQSDQVADELVILFCVFEIVFIDLVLAGDNAIIIGMVASQFADDQRKKIIFWGIGAAIVLRIIFTLITAYLLQINGLRLVGGILLLYIAYKLYIDVVKNVEDNKNLENTC